MPRSKAPQGDGAGLQKSVFLVKSEASSAKTVADELWKLMDNNDRLFVIEVAYNYAQANSICERDGQNWLERTLK